MNLEEIFKELMNLNIDERSIEEANLSEIIKFLNCIEYVLKMIDDLSDTISKDKELSAEEKENHIKYLSEGNEPLYYLHELTSAKCDFLLSLN